MGTAFLNLPYIASSQLQKEVTEKDQMDGLDSRLEAPLAVDLSAGDRSITLAQIQRCWLVQLNGAAVARDATIAAAFMGGRWFQNNGTAAVNVKLGTASIAVGPGAFVLLKCDNTANGLVQATPQFQSLLAADAFDAVAYVPGKPGNGATVLLVAFARKVLFPAGLAGSQAKVLTNPAVAAIFSLSRNGAGIGSISIAADGTPSFTLAAAVTFNAGDVLRVTAPSPQDATLADLALTLVGQRTV